MNTGIITYLQIKKYVIAFTFISIIIMFICTTIGFIKYNTIANVTSVFGLVVVSLLVTKYYGKNILYSIISDYHFKFATSIVFVITMILHACIIYNANLGYYSDFIIVKNQAEYMMKDFAIMPSYTDYFHAYPYQINIAVIINLLYKITGNYHYVEFITATIPNIAAIVAGLGVRNITKNNNIALIATVFCEVFSIACQKTFLPYSSNLVILFPILMLYFYTSQMSRTKKMLMIILTVAIGFNIKYTALIPFIAIVIVEGYRLLKYRQYRFTTKSLFATLTIFALFSFGRSAILNKIGFLPDPTIEHNTIYYFALGQNNEFGGQWYEPIACEGDIHRPKEVRDSLFLNMAFNYIKDRSALGQIKFFASKIAYCWGEIHQDQLKLCEWDNIILIIRHFTWYFALLLMTLGVWIIKDRKYFTTVLCILGVVAYLYLSEAGARYVVMFTPVVYMMMGWTLASLKKYIR